MARDQPVANPHASRRAPRLALVLGAVVIGLTIGVGIDILRVGGLEPWLAGPGSAPTLDLPQYVARGQSIDVAGRAVYLDCRGGGSPTVLLEAGFAAGASSWGHVLDAVAGFTRVCAWDRPGIGRSAPRGVHTAGETIDDLRAALGGAGETGPFVVVAHSFGGVYARIFAGAGPPPDGAPADAAAVIALVMIDTYEPDLGLAVDPALPADVRAVIRENLDSTATMLQAGEDLDWAATMAALDRAGTVTLPAIFLSVEPRQRYSDPDPERLATIIDAWYRAVAARYPNGRIEIVPDTGHLIHWERPALVVDRIRETVVRARGG